MKTLILVPSALEMKHLLPNAAMGGPLPRYPDGARIWGLCGVGAAATAMSTALYLAAERPDRVILAGIAGAFPDSGPQLEAVVQIRRETFADLGYQDAAGFHTLDQMHLPMLQGPAGALGGTYSLGLFSDALPAFDAVTVASVTSDQTRALALRDQFKAAVENMEGAAAAMACAFSGIPCYQIRAVSNWVGPRDPKSWRIKPALDHLRQVLDGLCPGDEG